MNWNFKSLALAAALAAASGGVAAQDFSLNWNPRSGDVWVDTQLRDMNTYGTRYREPFIDEMVRYHDAPRDLVRDLLVNQRWAPGDVYYACSIASIIGRPCRDVVNEWERDNGQGWGVIAKRMGIKPGSAEFHRLKKGFVPTYDRWARPINLDDDLHRAYPDRRKGKIAGAGKAKASGRMDHPGKGGHMEPGHAAGKGKSDHSMHKSDHPAGKGKSDKGKPAGKRKSGETKGNKGNGKG